MDRKTTRFDEMRKEFRLRAVRAVYVPEAKCAPVRGLYRGEGNANLLVVDKEPGGSKADAVNAGLNPATSPYVCIVDADSVLERDALRIMVPIMADPKRVVAVGGIIRVLNGSEIEGGHLKRVRLPRKSIEVIQVIEYLRAFLIGRGSVGSGKHADDHFRGLRPVSNRSGARRWGLSLERNW